MLPGPGVARDDSIEVALEVCVAVADGIFGAVRRIVRIQTIGFLPRVRHAVMIAVRGRFATFKLGEATDVVLRIDET